MFHQINYDLSQGGGIVSKNIQAYKMARQLEPKSRHTSDNQKPSVGSTKFPSHSDLEKLHLVKQRLKSVASILYTARMGEIFFNKELKSKF